MRVQHGWYDSEIIYHRTEKKNVRIKEKKIKWKITKIKINHTIEVLENDVKKRFVREFDFIEIYVYRCRPIEKMKEN